jgi:hypothetical protein
MKNIKKINVDGTEYDIKTEPTVLSELHPAYIPPVADGDSGSFNIWELETGEYIVYENTYLNYSNYDKNLNPLDAPLQFQVPGVIGLLRVYHSFPDTVSMCQAVCESGGSINHFSMIYGDLSGEPEEITSFGMRLKDGGVASGDGKGFTFYEWDGTDAKYNEIMFSSALHDVIVDEVTAIIVNTALEYDKNHLGRIYILDTSLGDPVAEDDKLFYILQSPASNVSTSLSAGSTGNYHNLYITVPKVKLEVDSTDPTTVKAITLSVYRESISAVKPGYDYSNPYMPQYDGSPATKKYVDDSIKTVPVPTKTSELTNDSDFTTKTYIDSKIQIMTAADYAAATKDANTIYFIVG